MDKFKHLILRYIENENGCWIHTNKPMNKGYVFLNLTGNNEDRILAHRASYILHKGEIPEGMLVCHSCDTRACINPNHLWLGTIQDNDKDRDEKKRGHWHVYLTDEEVEDIRGFYQLGFSQSKIARMLGLSRAGVHRIVHNQTRKKAN